VVGVGGVSGDAVRGDARLHAKSHALAQLEQVGLGSLLQLGDKGFVAKAAVASDQGRTLLGRELFQYADQTRPRFGCAVLFAGADDNIQH
jgi:hypothetical protein